MAELRDAPPWSLPWFRSGSHEFLWRNRSGMDRDLHVIGFSSNLFKCFFSVFPVFQASEIF